jgi:hypothetical protein
MSWRLVPPPTREDVAAEKLARECAGRGHSFPEVWPLDPAQVTAGPGASSQHRAPCPDCATVRVLSWQGPLPGSSTRSQGRTAIAMAMMVTYEAPEPGDVPGIADLAASVSYDEVAAARAAAVEPPHSARIGFYQDVVAVRDDSGHDDPLPAPGELTAARIELTLTVAAWQFYLLDAAEKPARILPVPEHAASAGIIDTVTGATLLWTGLRQGPVHLTVSIAPADPGADLEGYQDVAEISHRSTTGRLAIAGLAQTARALPPLPGYGDYRLRYHARDADAAHTSGHPVDRYLLQIWPAPRTRPVILQAVSQWASSRATVRAAPVQPGIPPGRSAAHGQLRPAAPRPPRPRLPRSLPP